MTQHTALASPAQERPRLLTDEPVAARVVIVVALLIGTFVLGHIVRYVYAAAHRVILALCILLFALLAFEGWHILTYLKPPWA